MKKTCIIISGPTAVGKTEVALNLARTFNTRIISADSRQCFKELTIGVAKPSTAELAEVFHYFINSHSIHDNISAADFEKYALQSAGEIFLENDIAIMVGGTGLYINAFCHGLDLIPETEKSIREEIIASYELNGMHWLQEQIGKHDPAYYATGEIHNPQRLMRALEVVRTTGKSILAYQTKKKAERPFDIIKIGLELPRNELYQRINERVDNMIASGLEKEALSLLPYRNLNALQTVGYRELFSYFDGDISRQHAIELIKQHTRNYAKRQITWFKKETDIIWLPPQMHEIKSFVSKKIKSRFTSSKFNK